MSGKGASVRSFSESFCSAQLCLVRGCAFFCLSRKNQNNQNTSVVPRVRMAAHSWLLFTISPPRGVVGADEVISAFSACGGPYTDSGSFDASLCVSKKHFVQAWNWPALLIVVVGGRRAEPFSFRSTACFGNSGLNTGRCGGEWGGVLKSVS